MSFSVSHCAIAMPIWRRQRAWRAWAWLFAGLFAGGLTARAACVAPPPGLIGWWSGDGATKDLASTNDAVLNGGANTTATGLDGQAFGFDGITGYAQIADTPTLHPANFTIETWVKFDSLDSTGSGGSPAGDQYLVFKQNSSSNQFEGFDLSKTREAGSDLFRLVVASPPDGRSVILSTTTVTTGSWYHVAAVRGSNYTQIYINGQLEQETNVTFAQDYGNLPLYFGTSGQSYWDHKLAGSLDEVSLYNRALSAAEIAAIYAAGADGKCKSLSGLAVTTQPKSQAVAIGGNVAFSVVASGDGPITYQWLHEGSAISGATNASLSLTGVQLTDAGDYSAWISNSTASVTSSVAVLTVVTPPVITQQPQSLVSWGGAPATFNASVSGGAPISFQWRFNGTNLANSARIIGANTASLSILTPEPEDAGDYALLVSNLAGVVISAPATLTIMSPPVITAQPISETVSNGTNVRLGVAATGTTPCFYRWRFKGADLFDDAQIFGAGTPNLAIHKAQTNNAGGYSVLISNLLGSVTSDTAILDVIVLAPPAIASQPVSQSVLAGSNVNFSVTAIGTTPLGYQWQFNGTTLANGARVTGATSSSLSISSLVTGDAGNYSVVVSNVAGIVTSAVAVLTVLLPPAITSQPVSQSVLAGSNVNFSATATGSAPLTYQWRFNRANLVNGPRVSGATSANLSISGLVSGDAGNYMLVASNLAGMATSAVATLTVLVPPAITSQPISQSVLAGSNVNFSATATGTAPLGYQWQFNGTNLTNGARVSGATSANLSISGLVTADAGNYSVMVSNVAGMATSAVAALTVLVPPVVTSQPASQSVLAGSNVNFSVTASGTAPLGYQWQFNGTNLANGARVSGAASASLSISGLLTGDAGNYSLVVSNVAGMATSAVATLTVLVPPVITSQPTSQSVLVGSNANFSATATGTAPLGFQWQFNGANLTNGARINGATSASLSISGLVSGDAGYYSLVVSNVAGMATSAVATLTVLMPPAITSQPTSQSVLVGSNVNFSVTATGTAPLGYQWQFNGVNLANGGRVSGATSANLSISNLVPGDAGNYSLVVSNVVGVATSALATLTVLVPPSISSQPTSQSVLTGSNVNFSATATGTAPLGYQWRFNGTNLANGARVNGATSPSLSISNLVSGDAGNYSLLVSNVAGMATSAVATLTLILPPSITAQPQNLTNVAGTTALFSATATGTSPLGYQWRFNGANLVNGGRITGVTSASLSISGLVTDDAGSYSLVVSNVAGMATSAVATLTVLVPPTITSQPVSQSVLVGTNVTFSVTATGTAPLSYRWRFNGTNLADGGQIIGSSGATLYVSSPQTSNAGAYSVVVSNVAGSTTSSVATLTVTSPANCAPTPSGLVGWWTGDGSAADFLGFDPGSLHGSATATAAGVVGQAFSFDGTNAFVQIPDSAPLRPANLTIETWVMFTALDTPSLGGSPAGDQYVIFKQNTQSGNFEGFDLGKTRVPGGDVFKLLISSALGESAEIHSATHISTNVWYHVAGVRGANFTQIYVNGVLENQTNIDFPQDYGTLPLYFGTSGQSYWDHKLAGMLDEVSLYNRALSSAEIASIYAAGAGGKCKVPVGPTIVTQPTRQLLVLNGTVNFSAMAVGSATIGYRWSKDGVYLANGGRISGATSSVLTLTNLQAADAGNYQVTVTNSAGTAVSQVALLSTELPPANDAFASAQAISGGSGFVTGSSANATKESGEPYHAGNAGGASVWYNWTAPSTSPVTFDTALTSFDTLLAVYTGSAVNALTLVASNDNISTNNSRSRLTFTPVAGTVYHIAVDGANGANGNLTLRWAQATTPLPDLSIVGSAVNPYISTETFSPSSCAVMEGLIQAGTRRLIRFDTETENSGTTSLYFGDPSTNSLFVWAPCHAHFHFQNYMSYRLRNSSGALVAVGLKVGFCILDVFRWDPNSASSALYTCNNQGIQRGWGDLYDHTLDGQWIDTTGLPDGNYTMELEANPLGIIQEANYGNNLTTVPISIGNPTAPPLNDNFASAQTLLGGFASTVGFTPNATKQAGEPNHAGNAGGHSVWYQWTAVSTKSVTIDTLSSSFNTLLAVYTGSSLSGLTVVASNDDIGPGVLQSRVTFPATAGTVYNIAVDGYNGASGNLVLTLNQTIQNDNFANAEFIGGVSGLVHGSTSGATKEAGEPNHAGNAGGHSIWYAWTAPVDGIATFDTIGSSFNTLLAAYTGGSLATLVPVASNDDISASNTLSRITFSAIGLSRYYLAIDGYNGDSGDSTMNWSLTATGVAAPPYLANQPSVLTYKFLSDGEFQLTVNGKPQQQYLIQRSDDLANWSTLAPTLADPNGHAYFIDKGGPHGILRSGIIDPICGPDGQTGIATAPRSTRFYRAIALNPN